MPLRKLKKGANYVDENGVLHENGEEVEVTEDQERMIGDIFVPVGGEEPTEPEAPAEGGEGEGAGAEGTEQTT